MPEPTQDNLPQQPTPDKFSDTELAKVGIDYVKHISTLSSGSIVIVATFFQKLADLHFRMLVANAMAFFASSMLLACVSMLALILHGARPEKRTAHLAKLQTFLVSGSVTLFVSGIFLLALFVILNALLAK
jgi:hypothetical protein